MNIQRKNTARLARARIIRLATQGGLKRIQGGITAAQLARIRCPEGYTALHYAARFGHLDEIRGGVTAEILAKVRAASGWIWVGQSEDDEGVTEITGGITALSTAVTYGYLLQINGTVTLSKLKAARNANGQSAHDALLELIQAGDNPVALGNNICACWDILKYLKATNPFHVAAVGHAVRQKRNLETAISPVMLASLL